MVKRGERQHEKRDIDHARIKALSDSGVIAAANIH
jgi:hypothetical protein